MKHRVRWQTRKLQALVCLQEETSKQTNRDFPGGPVVKNLPYNAGDTGSIPGQGTKIPHAVGQLNPCATTTKPKCPEACMPQLEKRKPAFHN